MKNRYAPEAAYWRWVGIAIARRWQAKDAVDSGARRWYRALMRDAALTARAMGELK